MIYPIVAYGDPILRKKAIIIDSDYPNLNEIIDNMFATMYNSSGVGLAAPQIGIPIRLFIVDAKPFSVDDPTTENFRKIFINAELLDETGNKWKFNEGCLSIPGVREDIERKPTITIRYQDINFETHTEEYIGVKARIIQHEYDHINGVLFTDRLTSLKKQLLKGRMNSISRGIVDVDYKMKFYNVKR